MRAEVPRPSYAYVPLPQGMWVACSGVSGADRLQPSTSASLRSSCGASFLLSLHVVLWTCHWGYEVAPLSSPIAFLQLAVSSASPTPVSRVPTPLPCACSLGGAKNNSNNPPVDSVATINKLISNPVLRAKPPKQRNRSQGRWTLFRLQSV